MKAGWDKIIMTPIVLAAFGKLFWAFIKYALRSSHDTIFEEQYNEAMDYLFNRAVNDKNFINEAIKIISESKTLSISEARKIAAIPIVTKWATEAKLKNNKTQEKNKKTAGIEEEGIKNHFMRTLIDAWDNPEIKNDVIDKIKEGLNNEE